jgi:S-adenosylmethionine:tRNA ribosyltransferase-isomerase
LNGDGSWQFDLPEELIAQDPPENRGDSRLLLVDPQAGPVGERVFRELPEILRPGDLLILNDSRVLPARLQTRRADTGGQVEILLIRPVAEGTWLAMAKPGRRLRPGIKLNLGGEGAFLEIVQKRDDGQVLVKSDPDPWRLAAHHGVMPLPPYIRRDQDDPRQASRSEQDRVRYQTIYNLPDSSGAGSVAAPTAGLHFSDKTMASLAARGIKIARVCLHVGPGTFKPPTSEQIASGRLHREFFRIGADTSRAISETRNQGGRVIAVGTTSLRVLESMARLGLDEAGADVREFAARRGEPEPFFTGSAEKIQDHWQVTGMTRLFLQPPDRVTAADGLLTNFHLPGSSLLMLVAALASDQAWRAAYAHAVDQEMRFYSYGDCMLILPGIGPTE